MRHRSEAALGPGTVPELMVEAWALAPVVSRRGPDCALARAANPSMCCKRAAAAMTSAAAFGLGGTEVAAKVLDVFPAEPDGAVLAGFGGAVLGPEARWFGLSAWTRRDEAEARQRFDEAAAFAERAGGARGATLHGHCGQPSTTRRCPLSLGLHAHGLAVSTVWLSSLLRG